MSLLLRASASSTSSFFFSVSTPIFFQSFPVLRLSRLSAHATYPWTSHDSGGRPPPSSSALNPFLFRAWAAETSSNFSFLGLSDFSALHFPLLPQPSHSEEPREHPSPRSRFMCDAFVYTRLPDFPLINSFGYTNSLRSYLPISLS